MIKKTNSKPQGICDDVLVHIYIFFPSQQQSKTDTVHNTMAVTKEQDRETSNIKKYKQKKKHKSYT